MPERKERQEAMAEEVARAFHDSYERLAPHFGYETREASAKPWGEVPEQSRKLMIATVETLLASGYIYPASVASESESLRRALEEAEERLRVSVPRTPVDCLLSTLSEVEIWTDHTPPGAIKRHVLAAVDEARRALSQTTPEPEEE